MTRSGKTGTDGRPWIELEQPKPSRVADPYAYITEPPPELSARCVYWARQIAAGWRPNRRIAGECYDCRAHWYGVYLWEEVNVLMPLLALQDSHEARRAGEPV